jgi:hypothetical protein
MADQKHLDILKQGVEAWNAWREQNPSTRPDLSEAHFYYNSANLTDANLTGVNPPG